MKIYLTHPMINSNKHPQLTRQQSNQTITTVWLFIWSFYLASKLGEKAKDSSSQDTPRKQRDWRQDCFDDFHAIGKIFPIVILFPLHPFQTAHIFDCETISVFLFSLFFSFFNTIYNKKMLENQKKKIFNLAIKRKLLPLQQDKSEDFPGPRIRFNNIFNCQKLEPVNDMAALPQYDILADKEMKEITKKIKKNGAFNKKLCESGITFSRKSYTIRTNEHTGNFFTKQELLESLGRKITDSSNLQSTQQSQKQSGNKYSVRKLRMKHSLMMERTDSNQKRHILRDRERIQKIKETSLTASKNHISPLEWIGTLRHTQDLNGIYREKQEKLEKIMYNGLKLVAKSKKNQQMEWVEKKSTATVFLGLQKKNSAPTSTTKQPPTELRGIR